MIALVRLFLAIAASLFKSRARLEAENTVLRQQLIVLRRKVPGRVKLTNGDRTIFVWLYRLYPSARPALMIVRPETLIRWHREGFRRYWRWKSRRRRQALVPAALLARPQPNRAGLRQDQALDATSPEAH